jgi:hypothetical protein
MFKYNLRNVSRGVCCAAMLCISMVEGMDPVIESDKKSDTPDFIAVTPKMSAEEYAQAEIKIQELAELAVSDMEKMRELVEFLCDPRIDSHLPVTASYWFCRSCDQVADADGEECDRRARMLNNIMNYKGLNYEPSYYWGCYNRGIYGAFLPEEDGEPITWD